MRPIQTAQDTIGRPYVELEEILKNLGEVLTEIGESDLVRFIPWIGEENDPDLDVLNRKHIHLYSIAFQLLNKIEERGAVRTRRKMENEEGLTRINGLWAKNLLTSKNAGISQAEIAEVIKTSTIEPVFTAHPTEVKRQTILEHHRELYLALVKLENQMYTNAEREEIRSEIKLVLERLWLLGEVQLRKPDVSMELSAVMHYLENILPEVIINLDRRLLKAWEEVGFDPELIKGPKNLPSISFGTWIGGDRDGHPLVTAKTTRNTLYTLRSHAIHLIRHYLTQLAKHLGFYYYPEQSSQTFRNRYEELMRSASKESQRELSYFEGEAFRQFVQLLILKLPQTKDENTTGNQQNRLIPYQSSRELISDLELLYKEVQQIGAYSIAESDVVKTIRLVNCFGFHLATLDIRQNSEYHEQALSQLMKTAGMEGEAYLTWNEQQRMDFIDNELRSIRPFALPSIPLDKEANEVVSCLRVVFEFREKYGVQGTGNVIVSMTRSASDLLSVYVLAKEAGLIRQTDEGPVCLIQVVPLFETIEDLTSSSGILESFLSHPFTKRSLEYQRKQNNQAVPSQLVMIGYSDSNKDGGIIASQWALYKTERELQKVGEKTGVNIRYFHGRGGTISRGAGPTQWFVKTLPHSTINGYMRLTEQGETIHQKYANLTNATYNLELLSACTVGSTVLHRNLKPAIDPFDKTMEFLAETSIKHYMNLIRHPQFITFYSQATPIDAIEASKIGSRPSRRTGQRTLKDLRAIPWVFSWGQARFNLTSWYGVGKALEELSNQYPKQFEQLVENTQKDTLIRYILSNVDTSLSATDESIMAAYAELVNPESVRFEIMELIQDELKRTRHFLSIVFIKTLKERRIHHYISNKLRAEALDILHRKQIALLKKWRASGSSATQDKTMDDTLTNLLLTVNGIASALRNTG